MCLVAFILRAGNKELICSNTSENVLAVASMTDLMAVRGRVTSLHRLRPRHLYHHAQSK